MDDEIDKIIKESMEIVQAERAKAAEYNKLSYREKLARKKGFTNSVVYQNWCAQQRGFANSVAYRNWQAQQRGFTNRAEYERGLCFKHGKGNGLSMAENKNSANYLGIVIAERLLPKIFNEPKMMPYGNKGYDAICKNNYKIDVKSSLLGKANFWAFRIRYNQIADAFLCIGFSGSRDDLDVKHIWLFPANETVRTCPLNEMGGLVISDAFFSLSCVARYELTEKVKDANDICMLFKTGVLN